MRTLITLVILVFASNVNAQDLRNSPFNVHGRGYDGNSQRGEVITEVDPKLAPFYHGVASGDPTPTSVIVWTRITPENGEASLPYRLKVWPASSSGVDLVFDYSGEAIADNDYCVKVDVTGLTPGVTYNYVFESGGRFSLIGRTHTTALEGQNHVRFAVASCSNFPAGFFNAYGAIGERNDLDAVIHLGDYIYEYEATGYGGQVGQQLGRLHEPTNEIITLADYRTRYAQYRLDPDLRRLHQQHPVIHVWDDHESANDSYVDGAENHSASEGSWEVRKAVSKRVHSEWMPIRDANDGRIYRSFSFGGMADLFMLDTRLDGRDKQVMGVGSLTTPQSRDSLVDPNRKIMSQQQFNWLTDGMSSSTARWKVLGNQVYFSPTTVAPIDTTLLFSLVPEIIANVLRPQLPALTAVLEQAFYGDVWNNYPAQRSALASFLKDESQCNIILSGDFHSGFAFDGKWPEGEQNVVEFVVPSITSNNFDETLQQDQTLSLIAPALLATISSTLGKLNPHLTWFDITQHGYAILDLTNNRAQCDFFMVDTILVRSREESWVCGSVNTCGATLTRAEIPASPKAVQEQPVPAEPPVTSIQEDVLPSPLTIVGHGANPATTMMYVTFVVPIATPIQARLVGINGEVAREEIVLNVMAGINVWMLDLTGIANGAYTLVLEYNGRGDSLPIVVQR